jgi:hypothetical protein
MMMKFHGNFHSDSDRHICESYRNGDWIIHSCPRCDYQLRENWRTGEMSVRNSKLNIKHSGSYFPREYQGIFENQN